MSQLFLSSTAVDLAEFRKIAIHVCHRLGIEVIAMEDFGPDPRAAAAVCQSKIAQSDLFLGLYAHRYGYVPDGFGGESITELEYEWAMQRKPPPPVLLFLVDEDLPWPPKYIDDGEANARLRRLKKRLRKQHTVKTLTTPEQFKEDLFVYLPKFTDRAARRVVAGDVLPIPPEPYVAHQYTLLQTSQVVGRETELRTLDCWLSDPTSELTAARLLCIVAIGGMGKSALTWKWFQQHTTYATSPLAGRFWWSFYESDAGYERFVTTALSYCSGRPLETIATLPTADRETQLLAILDRHPFLLVLDGLERVLIAYSNLDFAHLADEDLDRRTANAVAGARGLPQEAGSSFIGQHRLRKTIDPRIGSFLRKLAHVKAARILLTTRLYPSELQTTTGYEIPGTAAWFLRGMTPDDALLLWRAMRVSGSHPELAKLFASIDHYPLLIRALAGEVSRYRSAPGDFDRWRRDHPDFDPFSLPLVQAKSHVLAHALGSLRAEAREVLHTIAAFRSAVSYDTVAALFVQRARWPADKLDELLTELEDRGLLGWDRTLNQYDLHPIVRGVVWRGLDDFARRAVYQTLARHFSAIPRGNDREATEEEAATVIDLFHALIGTDRHDDAAKLYIDRLAYRFSFPKARMAYVNIAMLERFFPSGVNHPPRLKENIDDIYLHLGQAYSHTGRLQDACSCYERGLEQRGYLKPTLHRAMATALLALGWIRKAKDETLTALSDPMGGSGDYGLIALCEATRGAVGDARARLDTQYRATLNALDDQRSRLQLWLGDHATAAAAAERFQMARRDDLTVSVVLAEAWMNLGRTKEANNLLTDTLTEARARVDLEREIEALRVLAEFHRRLRDFDQSRAYLEDLAELAARGPYRLIQADAANVRAELERDCGNRDLAIAAAQDAYRFAWCDGPPYAYHWALEHAKRLLRELGAPVPTRSDSHGS